jgi:hypothetical protein
VVADGAYHAKDHTGLMRLVVVQIASHGHVEEVVRGEYAVGFRDDHAQPAATDFRYGR